MTWPQGRSHWAVSLYYSKGVNNVKNGSLCQCLPKSRLYNKQTWPLRSIHLYSLSVNCMHHTAPVSGRVFTTVDAEDSQYQQRPPGMEHLLDARHCVISLI